MTKLRQLITIRELKYQMFNAISKVPVEGVMKGTRREICGTSSFPFAARMLCQRRRAFTSLQMR
jgi:hypothetical protein